VESVRYAAYIAGAMLVGMIAREYVRAFVATRLGDPTPRLWGRLTWNPRSWFDPFGTGLVPGLILVGLAGPCTNIVLGVLAGIGLRLVASPRALTAIEVLVAFELTQFSLAIFHLLPIPGLDGARLVGLALPPDAARVYRNGDKYLPLFVLVAIFVLAGPISRLVYGLVDALCQLSSGFRCAPG
jgi:Zn-dependent protease